jgi:hypothetical protein
MRTIASIVANYDGASGGFTEGTFRNNPGDDTGSGVMAAFGNDLWYAVSAMITKYKGAKSGSAESVTSSDFVDAIDAALGGVVSGVSAWDSSTDYSTSGTISVMRYGVQFTSILASGNVNKDPVLEPTFWLPVPTARELFDMHSHGRLIHGGSIPLHNHTNAGYRQFFSLGTHKLGGASGYAFNAWGVHIDGSAVGSGALSDIVEAWHMKDVWAPGSVGARTLVDGKGRLLRAIDATGGQAAVMGEVLADRMQGHIHTGSVSSGNLGGVYTSIPSAGASNQVNATVPDTGFPKTDGTNGTPRTGSTTRDKSVTVGVPYAVICVPV